MPFGSADRELLRQLGNQLGQITADLAALKQQAADQQHAIDQTRQDTNAAITTGLAEIRAVAREGLARTNEIVTSPLAGIGNELVSIRGAIGQLDNQLRAAAATATTPAAPQPEHEPAEDAKFEPASQPAAATQKALPADEDDTILRAAAGISAATLHAHRDTWEFLVKHAGPDQHFHLPATATLDEAAIEVRVSGPSLVAALTSLNRVSRTNPDPGTRAIAAHLHARLTETVEEILTWPHRGDGAEAVRIVIDDRARMADNEPQS
ncbi:MULTISPECIES: hypothetical protein [Streptomyces]|uniref:hypothetical protein n=1 Tax=Streptomyces TaxID=1883 RepID=UPI000A378BB0|nr:hypothetical protein [Streptomyces viridochromogenes]